MKRDKLILGLLSIVILIIFAFPVILSENASISVNSAPPLAFGICSVFYAVIAFANKGRGNLFALGRNKLFIAFLRSMGDGEADTDSDEYRKEFALSAFIFCVSIPFYIPLAFFAESFYTALSLSLSVTVLRLLLTTASALILRIMKNVQDKKQERIRDEADRKEQERRESMGKWK